AVASAASSVRCARTISSSGSTATGLKKWNPTTRSGCSRSAAIAVTDSDEVLVASTHSGLTIFSSSAQTCFFTPRSSNTASTTKSASANTSLSTEPETNALIFAARTVGERRVLGQRQEFQRLVGGRNGAVQPLVELLAREEQHAVPHVAVHLGPPHGFLALDDPGRPLEGALQEVGRLEQHVRDAQLVRLCGLEHLVQRQRVLDDDLR